MDPTPRTDNIFCIKCSERMAEVLLDNVYLCDCGMVIVKDPRAAAAEVEYSLCVSCKGRRCGACHHHGIVGSGVYNVNDD